MKYIRHSQLSFPHYFPPQFSSLLSPIILALLLISLATVHTFAASKTGLVLSFNGVNGKGPSQQLTLDSSGNLYGTTPNGGAHGQGVVFKLSNSGNGWTQTKLYSFCATASCADGKNPQSSLQLDSDGNLYGTTYYGGVNNGGTVFELSPSSSGAWTESVLYSFCPASGCADGEFPDSLTRDAAGNFVGTTYYGGENPCSIGLGCGVIFELSPASGGSWKESVLHAFTGANGDGNQPNAVSLATHGNLFGTTYFGGANAGGAAFELSSGGDGTWTESTLYSFCAQTSCADGASPTAGLVSDAKGNLYGTTSLGGQASSNMPSGNGVVFELSNTSGTWSESVLLAFDGTNGAQPLAGLTLDAAGNLYGDTSMGGLIGSNESNFGVIFELSPTPGGSWQENILHTFAGGPWGSEPTATLLLAPSGPIFGTTSEGGAAKDGLVFSLGR